MQVRNDGCIFLLGGWVKLQDVRRANSCKATCGSEGALEEERGGPAAAALDEGQGPMKPEEEFLFTPHVNCLSPEHPEFEM